MAHEQANSGLFSGATGPQRALMARLWGRACPPEAVVGLADIYAEHADFVARNERLSPRFFAWLPAAMKAHAARLAAGG